MNTNATVGFIARNAPVTNQYPGFELEPTYKVKIKNNQIYCINNNVIDSITITDSISNRIRLERNGNTISTTIYDHSGEMVNSHNISTIDNSSYYYIYVSLEPGSDTVYNLKTNGFDDSIDSINWFNKDNLMRMEYSTADQARYQFVLKSPCDGNDIITPEPPSPYSLSLPLNDSIYVYNNDPNDWKQKTVFIQLSEPSSGVLCVYDVFGRMIDTKPLNRTLQQQEIQITLPVRGVYIIKVETPNNPNNKKLRTKVL